MLQAIRNNAQGLLVWIVVGLIVISFALFGLGSYLSGASKVVAASVNGVDISSTELTRAHQNYQERLRQMFGEQYRPEMFANARVKNEVLNGLITQEVMNQMLTEQGYIASSAQVFDKLKSYEAFQDDGEFSAERYKEVLATQRINGEAFENDLSRDIASQQIRAAISNSAFLTANEQKTIAALENQKRQIGYFDISINPYKKSVKVTDEQIKSHYDKNSQQYLSTEKVQLEYLELKMDDIAALQDVTDEQIKQQYESSPDSYMENDDTAAKKKLSELRKKIKNGADFADIAKQHSDDKGSAAQGGDLGYVTRGVEEKFDEAVFSLKKGELSEVIKSASGFQLIQLVDIRKGDPEERKVRHILIKPERKLKPLADVKQSIKKELQLQMAGKVFFDDADEMNNLSYESQDSLQPVAEALGLKVKTSPLMTRRGTAGIFSNPKVLAATFSDDVLNQGRNSELLEISDTHFVVLRVKEHQVAKVLPLERVKSRIKNRLLQEQASAKTSEVTDDILARANNNETIEAILKVYPEVKWNKSSWITRKPGKDDKLSSQIRQHAYAMAKPVADNASWSKVTTQAGNQAVVALYKVEEVADATTDNKQVTQVLGNADYNSFVEHLKSQADININQEVVEADSESN